GVFRDLYRDDRPVVIAPTEIGHGVATQRIAIAARAGDEVLGSIWAAMDGPLTPERTSTLREAAKLVAVHLLRVRAGEDAERRLRTELVGRAIEGGAEARDALERLGLAGHRVCVAAATLASGKDGEQRSDQDLLADRERLTDALALNLSAVQRGAAVALVGDTVYGILPVADQAAEDRTARLAEDFLQRVGTRLPALIGLGQSAESVAEIARSRTQARRVLRVLAERPSHRSFARLADVETE